MGDLLITKTKKGVAHQTCRGLFVARENINSEAMSLDDFKIAQVAELREAKRRWNEFAKSQKTWLRCKLLRPAAILFLAIWRGKAQEVGLLAI